MATPMEAIVQGILTNPSYRPVLSILKGLRNGLVYGAKIRLPHALVMTFLFKSGPLLEKLRSIFRATYQHATNLASFVTIYKTITTCCTSLNEGKLLPIHSFIAAFIGGYCVFGERNGVNEQINLYLLSRILMGLSRFAMSRGYLPKQETNKAFSVFAALVWGIVLWLFEFEQPTLQPSLQSSMTYLYHDSNIWTNIWNFLFWNNDRVW